MTAASSTGGGSPRRAAITTIPFRRLSISWRRSRGPPSLGDATADTSADRVSVGVGIPGAISPATGLIKNANSTWLNGRPFESDLARALGRPVRLANDANCFALSEATDGAAAGAAVVFGVIIGTGTGGGLVVNGRVVVGANAIAGEWGHNPLPAPEEDERPGPECYCGRSGCIETFLSGPGLARDYLAHGGEDIPAIEIAARAARGEARATGCLDRYERRFARAIASVINVVDPDVVVLGGGLSNIAALVRARARAVERACVFGSRGDQAAAGEARRRQWRARRRLALGLGCVRCHECEGA